MRMLLFRERKSLSLENHCSKCADNCCKWGPLLLMREEWTAIKTHLETEQTEWSQKALTQGVAKLVDQGDFWVLEKAPTQPCPFLSTANRCGIYQVRPLDCQIWPLYYPQPGSAAPLSIAPRCPAQKHLSSSFIHSAWKAIQQVPIAVQSKFFQLTTSSAYQLHPITSNDLESLGSSGRLLYESTAKALLMSFFFAYALVEAVKCFVIVLGVQASLPFSYAVIAHLMFGYFLLNGFRYLSANLELTNFISVARNREAYSLNVASEILRITEGLIVVAAAMWLRIPGSKYSEQQWPPIQLDLKMFMQNIGSVVGIFLFLNLALALVDVAWCLVMEKMLFVDSRDRSLRRPRHLREWINSGVIEIFIFSLSLLVLAYCEHTRLPSYIYLNCLIGALVLPFIPLLRELLLQPILEAYRSSEHLSTTHDPES